jgi:hypothetical protein
MPLVGGFYLIPYQKLNCDVDTGTYFLCGMGQNEVFLKSPIFWPLMLKFQMDSKFWMPLGHIDPQTSIGLQWPSFLDI